MNKKVLPIGTVVKLKGGTRNLMITGFKFSTKDDEKVYDYVGCIFPEGIMENVYSLFDGKQIEEVIYMGYESEKHDKITTKIKNTISPNRLQYREIIDVTDSKEIPKKRRVPKDATHPVTAAEMRAKYGVIKDSDDGTITVKSNY